MSPEYVALRGRGLLVIAVTLLLPWLILLYILQPWEGPTVKTVRRPLVVDAPKRSAGSWGDIEYTRITIAPPDEFLREMLPAGGAKETTWFITDMTEETFTEFVDGLDLTDSQRTWLKDSLQTAPLVNGYKLHPDSEFIRTLSPSARAAIYHRLGETELNMAQERAYRFCGEPDEWFADATLPEPIIERMQSMVYENGRFRFFADIDLLLPLLETQAQRLDLVKLLARESTLLMRLHINADTDIDQLVEYWGKGGRSKDVRPLLESLSRLPGEQYIDVVHLLPPFARRRLYTYPHVIADGKAHMRDCHWTSLNFFNEVPDERLTDPDFQFKRLTNDYYPVYGDHELGDLVFFMAGSNQLYHTAVYIADDVLFTKNGALPSRPWMLVRLEDMQDYYPKHDPIEVHYFRRRGR